MDFSDPVAVVEAFVTAWQNGDIETMNSLLTEDSNFEPVQEENAAKVAEQAPTIEEIAAVDEDGETASVEAVLAVPDAEEPLPGTFELDAVDGEWRIDDILPTGQKYAPTVEFELDTSDGTVTITHVSGDAVPADQLFVRGEGLGRTGAWHDLSEEFEVDDEVRAGDSLSIGIESEYSINLVWDDGEHSAMLAGMSGTSESATAGDSPIDRYLSDANNYEGTVVDLTGEDEVTVEVGTRSPEYAFDPAAIRIDQGTTVTWEWVDDGAHTITHENGEFDADVLDGEGTTFNYTFEESGTYRYYCEPHKALGMKGALVVE